MNQKCLKCSLLCADEARQLHGAAGDRCWDDLRCHKRRSHYRNRGDRNAKRSLLRDTQRQQVQPETIAVAVDVPAIAKPVLVIYSERPHDFRDSTDIHAVGAELWVGTQQQARIEPLHCVALTTKQIESLLTQILAALSQHYGGSKPFTKYYTVIHRHVRGCPTRPCPLH